MRIGCVIHSLNGGGAERVMAGLASRLAERGHAVTLVTLDDGQNDRHTVSPAVSRKPLNVMSTADRPVSMLQRIRRLRTTITRTDFDVMLSFCDANNLLVLLSSIGLRNAPRVIVSERSDPSFQTLGRARELLRNRLYRYADKVVCLNEDVATTLRRRTGTSPVVIPSAVEPIRGERVRRLPDEPVRLIAAGRLEPEKGFDRLLRALAVLRSREDLPEWRLEILGDGGQRSHLEALCDELGLRDSVRFHGWVRPIAPYWLASDLFILPSHYEGFPSAMLEAMSGGVAVVAVDAGGGVRDAIEHGVNGWLVRNDDTALVDGIHHVLADESLRQRLAHGAADISDRFSWTAMVDAYEQILQDSVAS